MTFSSTVSLSSNSLTCVLKADQSPADFLDDRHCTRACVAKTMSQHTCVSHVSQCINARLMSLQSRLFTNPSKMPKKCSLHSCDCARCKRRYTFSYSTVRRHRMIYGVESEASCAVPETASTTTCASATANSNSIKHFCVF